jgi:hypothetical protein
MSVRMILVTGFAALALTMSGCKKKVEQADEAGDIRVDPALTMANDKALMRAPAPTVAEGAGKAGNGMTAASAQGCGKNLNYSLDWAKRLPAAMPIYPEAKLIEAAGADAGQCTLRVVSFTSTAPMQTLIDWYYTQAVRSGFSSEHQIKDGDHILAGVREEDDSAYYIFFAEKNGGVEVDLIANNGV